MDPNKFAFFHRQNIGISDEIQNGWLGEPLKTALTLK